MLRSVHVPLSTLSAVVVIRPFQWVFVYTTFGIPLISSHIIIDIVYTRWPSICYSISKPLAI